MGLDLKEVVSRLQSHAPLRLAMDWDNVGLLVEPTHPHEVKRMLLTIDMTDSVLDEALSLRANLVLSYHPPLFTALKRLGTGQRTVVRAIEHRVAVYSPHTAYDVVEGGVSDWLAGVVAQQSRASVTPLERAPAAHDEERTLLTATVAPDNVPSIRQEVQGLAGAKYHGSIEMEGGATSVVVVECDSQQEGALASVLGAGTSGHVQYTAQRLLDHSGGRAGLGRLVEFAQPIKVEELVARTKQGLGIRHVLLAMPRGRYMADEVTTVALCAGSGASVLRGVAADVYLTGEMGHHEVLAALQQGTVVVLCGHSNTERGFLDSCLLAELHRVMGGAVDVVVSQADRDPLEMV